MLPVGQSMKDCWWTRIGTKGGGIGSGTMEEATTNLGVEDCFADHSFRRSAIQIETEIPWKALVMDSQLSRWTKAVVMRNLLEGSLKDQLGLFLGQIDYTREPSRTSSLSSFRTWVGKAQEIA